MALPTQTQLVILHPETSAQMKSRLEDAATLAAGNSAAPEFITRLITYARGLGGGDRQGIVVVRKSDDVPSTGTVTFSASKDGDAVVVNGATFTGKTGSSGDYLIDPLGRELQTANSFAAAVNASTSSLAQGVVFALPASGSDVSCVVTLQSLIYGTFGDATTLSASAAASSSLTSSGGFGGGTAGTCKALYYGYKGLAQSSTS